MVAGQVHSAELLLHARNIPEENIILEPVGRNTLPCIGLAGLYIRRREAASVMVTLPGEQFIENEPEFRNLLMHAAEVASDSNCIVTLGIKPTNPATRFGYVRLGDEIACRDNVCVFKVEGFTEKPPGCP